MWTCHVQLILFVILLENLSLVSSGDSTGGTETHLFFASDRPLENELLNTRDKLETGSSKRKERPRAPFLDALKSSSQEEVTPLAPDDGGGGVGEDMKIKRRQGKGRPIISNHNDTITRGMNNIRRTQVILPLQQHHFIQEQSGDTTINCHCDTPECVTNGRTTCLSMGMCYTQFLQLEDGSPPITRGCIMGQTPLLCENRRPKKPGPYPHLSCCRMHYCNAGPLTLSNTTLAGDMATRTMRQHINQRNVNEKELHPKGIPAPVGKDRVFGGSPHDQPTTSKVKIKMAPNDMSPTTTVSLLMGNGYMDMENHDSLILRDKVKDRGNQSTNGNGISPLASASLISGAASVLIISAIGYYFLRRERRTEIRSKDLDVVVVSGDVLAGDGKSDQSSVTGAPEIQEKFLLRVPERESWC